MVQAQPSHWPSLAAAAESVESTHGENNTNNSDNASSTASLSNVSVNAFHGKKEWKKLDIPIRHTQSHSDGMHSNRKSSKNYQRSTKKDAHNRNSSDSSNRNPQNTTSAFAANMSNNQKFYKKRMTPRRIGRTRSQMSYQEQSEIEQSQVFLQWVIYQM